MNKIPPLKINTSPATTTPWLEKFHQQPLLTSANHWSSNKKTGPEKNQITRWWQLKYFWNFHPYLREDEPILTSIFFKWVGWKTTSQIMDTIPCASRFLLTGTPLQACGKNVEFLWFGVWWVNEVNKVAVRVGGLLQASNGNLFYTSWCFFFFIWWSCLVRKDRHVANLLKFLFLATLAPATFEDFFTN